MPAGHNFKLLTRSQSERLVPRGGIEPPTQGFSVLCSTTELPWPGGHGRTRISDPYIISVVL